MSGAMDVKIYTLKALSDAGELEDCKCVPWLVSTECDPGVERSQYSRIYCLMTIDRLFDVGGDILLTLEHLCELILV